jgi:hypothetical protein
MKREGIEGGGQSAPEEGREVEEIGKKAWEILQKLTSRDEEFRGSGKLDKFSRRTMELMREKGETWEVRAEAFNEVIGMSPEDFVNKYEPILEEAREVEITTATKSGHDPYAEFRKALAETPGTKSKAAQDKLRNFQRDAYARAKQNLEAEQGKE